MDSRNQKICRLVCWLVLGWGVSLGTAASAAVLNEQSPRAKQLAGYQEQYRELTEQYEAKLKQLADTAEASGFAEEAQSLRELAVPFDSAKIQSESLPRKLQPDLPLNLPKAESWRLELRKVREKQAADLYLLSRNVLRAGFPSEAYRLVREVALANPDHAFARRILGFQRMGDEWITPFEAQQSIKRMVWHDQFGWLPRTYVDRYEQGERFFRRWMPAEKEAEVRRDFRNAWEVETEHFLVRTNHSLERGVEVAKKLEEYHDFFVQTFPGFFHTPAQLQQLFNKAGASGRNRKSNPFVVHYYRTREEYNQALVQKIPQIEITNGLYHNGDRVAYFYHGPKKNNDSTLYHEATHQLLFETRFPDPRTAHGVGEHANFWIIEGIACYMESLNQTADKQTLGDPKFVRFFWARVRYLTENYYVPLGQLASLGMREFQNQTTQDLSRNYSQSSGLVHFFMHYKGGVYRDALVEHLSQIYEPGRRRPPDTLAELTGLPFSELDKQYGDYLRAQQDALKSRRPQRTPN